MTITLPDEMRESLETRAAAAGFDSVDDFVEDALGTTEENNGAVDWIAANRDALIALAERGRASPPIPHPEAFLAEIIRRTTEGESVLGVRR